jgi:hypothetical protein
MGQQGRSRDIKIVISTAIHRPVGVVWQWYAVDHVRNHPRWDPDMELAQMTDGPVGMGTRIRRRNRHFDEPIEGEMEIVEWQPEQVMGTRIRDANMETHGRVTFAAMGPNGTLLTIEADFPGMAEATADRIRPLIERSARNIRHLIESEA